MINHQVFTFIKVAKFCSFSKAVEEMYISTVAIKKQIDSLENR